jgi:hypothetical protein
VHDSLPSFVVVNAVPDRRRNVRSSVADLRILYANQMQNLHSQIEGAAKYVPTMPGRHIITEMDGVLALNAATYKVDHAVKFVVLDDAVLVARRRRRRNNAESEKLVAERCWMLGEMLVLDSKDAASEYALRTHWFCLLTPDFEICRTFSRSGMEKKHMSTKRRQLGIRKACWQLSGPLLKTLQRSVGRNERASMNDGRVYGFLAM